MPKRGTIYDINGNVLANDVVSYTLIAYLSNERVDAKGNKNYVEDIDDTSTKLAGVLGVTSEEIKDVLVKGKESNKYQVEFGTIGKGLSELTKEEIDKLKLQELIFLKILRDIILMGILLVIYLDIRFLKKMMIRINGLLVS